MCCIWFIDDFFCVLDVVVVNICSCGGMIIFVNFMLYFDLNICLNVLCLFSFFSVCIGDDIVVVLCFIF